MKEQFYKVTLLSDVVLNSSLATEGNMNTLDYIPGSNFMGIVARKLYNECTPEVAFSYFHSGKVRFGDAFISNGEAISYPMPAAFFMEKGNVKLDDNKVYLYHLIDTKNLPSKEGKRLQLKQQRTGYLFSDGKFETEIQKSFAIKSAQERKTRTSKEGALFGFESLNKGLEFVFSVQFDNETDYEAINKVIVGNHRLGKSRNAEFGQIAIAPIEVVNPITVFESKEYTLVYAQSNLCFVNEFGAPTFQPTEEQLGLNKDSNIDWAKSQIRTFSYSPWNFKRNTTNTQRDCIAKGSVFYVKDAIKKADYNTVGLHQTEGLGKVIYNPKFLEGNSVDAKSSFGFKTKDQDKSEKKVIKSASTTLSLFLDKKLKEKKKEKVTSEAIQSLIYSNTLNNLKRISSSQWGGIRAYATKTKNYEELHKQLFDTKVGYLTHGVADEKYWGKNRGANLKAFKEIFEANKNHDTEFIAKFAAEMAKENKRLEKGEKNGQ